MTFPCILGQPGKIFLPGSIADTATHSPALHLPVGLTFCLQTRDLLLACNLAPIFCTNLRPVTQTFVQSQELSWIEAVPQAALLAGLITFQELQILTERSSSGTIQSNNLTSGSSSTVYKQPPSTLYKQLPLCLRSYLCGL